MRILHRIIYYIRTNRKSPHLSVFSVFPCIEQVQFYKDTTTCWKKCCTFFYESNLYLECLSKEMFLKHHQIKGDVIVFGYDAEFLAEAGSSICCDFFDCLNNWRDISILVKCMKRLHCMWNIRTQFFYT